MRRFSLQSARPAERGLRRGGGAAAAGGDAGPSGPWPRGRRRPAGSCSSTAASPRWAKRSTAPPASPRSSSLPDAAGPLAAPLKLALEPLETLGSPPGHHGHLQPAHPAHRLRQRPSLSAATGFHYETMGPLVSGVSGLNDNFSRYALGPVAATGCWPTRSARPPASPRWSTACSPPSTPTAMPSTTSRSARGANRNPHYDPPTLRNDPRGVAAGGLRPAVHRLHPAGRAGRPPPPDPRCSCSARTSSRGCSGLRPAAAAPGHRRPAAAGPAHGERPQRWSSG